MSLRVRSFGVIRDRISDPRSVWIMAHQRNRRIHDQSGFTGSFDAPWSRTILDHWSWFRSPQRNTPLEKFHDVILTSKWKPCYEFLKWVRRKNSEQDLAFRIETNLDSEDNTSLARHICYCQILLMTFGIMFMYSVAIVITEILKYQKLTFNLLI